ncbi:protein of unknown function [Mesotoga infera]|uniref:Uncharacterized protein n=1 Tax=Mesotoga infera TaxID=1236046 RepID=A0A7Z7PQA5_9BACT|nr:protein of unknown function [Mesotoga infera]
MAGNTWTANKFFTFMRTIKKKYESYKSKLKLLFYKHGNFQKNPDITS